MSFAKRALQAILTIGQLPTASPSPTTQPVFTSSIDSNQMTISGHRMIATITKAGGALLSELHLQIFGMSLSDMNDLSTLGMLPGVLGNNTVQIITGTGSQSAIVFEGTINNAWTDIEEDGNASFRIFSLTGAYQLSQKIPPTSYGTSVDVVTIIQKIASQIGLPVENSGISGIIISKPYIAGSARTQLQAVLNAANINGIIDNGVIAIWPKGGSRQGVTPVVSAATGMVGYPTFNPQGIMFKTLYNPNILYGGLIQMQSIITPANGTWRVYGVDHNLSCELPNGPWHSQILAGPPGQTVVR